MSSDFMIRRQAYNLFLEGHGYKITAKKLGQNEHTVRDWFRRFNAKAFDSLLAPETKKKRHSQETKSLVIQLRKKGMSWSQIMKQTHVPTATAKNWVRNKDLTE